MPVRIVIPADVVTYPESGQYGQQYDAAPVCTGDNEHPQWSHLAWSADVPDGTALRFELRTAATESELAAADPVVIDVTERSSPVNLLPILEEAEVPDQFQYMRIDAKLDPSPDTLRTPVLHGYELTVHCSPAE